MMGTERELLLKKDPRPWETLAGSRGMPRMGGVAAGMSCRTLWGHTLRMPLVLRQQERSWRCP